MSPTLKPLCVVWTFISMQVETVAGVVPVAGYSALNGDCPGNNIKILRPTDGVSNATECGIACNATAACVGFSWTAVGDATSKDICVTKSVVCSAPRSTAGWVFYKRDGVVPQVQPDQMLVLRPCNANPAYAPQAWQVSSPGNWPAGSFNESQPNVINPKTQPNLCLNADGGMPGWAARVWPCATSHNPQYWGDPLAQISSSVFRHDSSTGQLRVHVATSTRGTPNGEACLRSTIPDASGNWWFTEYVSMWFCNSSDRSQLWVARGTANTPRLTLRDNPSLCLEAVPRPANPPPPATPPGPSDPVCTSGCKSAPCSSFLFCNTSASWQDRANDLVSRLSLSEKVRMLSSVQSEPPSRFGLAESWMHFGEAQHGLVRSCLATNGEAPRCATSFPALCGIGATANKSLFYEMGEVISDEARAWANIIPGTNLVFWAPNINLHRNFLWGRNQETPGEDPTINGEYATQFIAGMQGGVQATNWNSTAAPMLKTAPTIKHYIAYDVECTSGGPDSAMFSCPAPGVDRFHMKAVIPASDFVDYYLAPFRKTFSEAKPASIMCSFNTVNNTPSCSNGLLSNTIARDEFGFDGFIVTDCGGIPFLQQGHYWVNGGPPAAVAGALKNGTDAECGIPGPWGEGYLYHEALAESIRRGLVDEDTVNRAISRKWRTAFRLGLFDDPSSNPWAHLGKEDIGSAAHKALALSAAAQSMTLLKNEDLLLPLKPGKYNKIAIIGPAQNITTEMQGGYSGHSSPITSPGAALSALLGPDKLVWALGTGGNDTDRISDAVTLVESPEVNVAIIFLQDTYVAEFTDRTDTKLQYGQQALVASIAAVDKPVILVIFAGHTVALDAEQKLASAILMAYLPSEMGGQAVVDCLMGVSPPAGRLPFTMYPHSIVAERRPTDMSLRGGPGVTYLYYNGTPLWPFGFGLSYTTWDVQWVDRPPESISLADLAGPISLKVTVFNTGSISSSFSVHGYVNFVDIPNATHSLPVQPIRELFDFDRVFVDSGSSVEVKLALPLSVLANGDVDGHLAVRPGQYKVSVGGMPHLEGAAEMTFNLHGQSPYTVFSLPEMTRRYHSNSMSPH